MSFSGESNFQYLENPAMRVASGKIPVDGTGQSEVIDHISATTGASGGATGEPANYNGRKAELNLGKVDGVRYMLQGSYIAITGYAARVTAAGVSSIVPDGVSIPFNPIAAIISSIDIKLNDSQSLLEKYEEALGHASMMKILTTKTKQELESMHDTMFTPCIEERRDLNTGGANTDLSLASQYRRKRPANAAHTASSGGWLVTDGGNINIHTKNIPLSMLFDSCSIPAAFYISSMQINLLCKPTTGILIYDTGKLANGGIPQGEIKYFVTNIELYYQKLELSAAQMPLEKEKFLSNPILMLGSYKVYEASEDNLSTSHGRREPTVRNLQSVILAYPSMTTLDNPAGGTAGANPYQYTYGTEVSAGPTYNGPNGYQVSYNGIYSPPQSLSYDLDNFSMNTALMAQYRFLTGWSLRRGLEPAIDFSHMRASRENGVDSNPYVLFCANFFTPTTYAQRNSGGAVLNTVIKGSTITGSGGLTCKIRMGSLEMRTDGKVYTD